MLLYSILLLVTAVGVIQLPDGSYQVPDNWSGCFVNPDDPNDTTFGCPGPVGSPDDSKIKTNATIIIHVQNGTMNVFSNGTVK